MSNNLLIRIFIIILVVIVAGGLFGVIIRREIVMFGFQMRLKGIILVAISIIVLLGCGLLLTMSSWTSIEILGLILLWIIYVSRVLAPLFIVRDILSIWYKIPSCIIIGISLLYVGFGIYKGTSIKTTQLSISSDLITKEYKIVFISDIHVEAIHNRGYVQSIVHHIQETHPDIVLIGGDLMNTAKLAYVEAFLPFNQLKMPVYAIAGNHDHMGNTGALLQIFETTKILPLGEKSIAIDGIQIVGIDDKSYRGNKKLPEILKESSIVESGQFTILVSHEPEKLSKLTGYPINLELAGHTHNGQFFPINRLIKPFVDYTYGEYHLNNMIAFVSQGIGSWGAPIRIGTQSELVLISLKPKYIKN